MKNLVYFGLGFVPTLILIVLVALFTQRTVISFWMRNRRYVPRFPLGARVIARGRPAVIIWVQIEGSRFPLHINYQATYTDVPEGVTAFSGLLQEDDIQPSGGRP